MLHAGSVALSPFILLLVFVVDLPTSRWPYAIIAWEGESHKGINLLVILSSASKEQRCLN